MTNTHRLLARSRTAAGLLLVAAGAVVLLLLLITCRSPQAGDTLRRWQVVREPGATSCAAVELVYAGDFDHREQIGVYQTQEQAEAALARFRATRDRMTAAGRMICQ